MEFSESFIAQIKLNQVRTRNRKIYIYNQNSIFITNAYICLYDSTLLLILLSFPVQLTAQLIYSIRKTFRVALQHGADV